MDKLNGVVVYREATNEGFLWAARVYRNGKTVFQSAERKRDFNAVLKDGISVAGGEQITLRIGPDVCYLHARIGDYRPSWLKGWVKRSLDAEEKRYVKRMNRRGRALLRQIEADRKRYGLPAMPKLVRANVSTRCKRATNYKVPLE